MLSFILFNRQQTVQDRGSFRGHDRRQTFPVIGQVDDLSGSRGAANNLAQVILSILYRISDMTSGYGTTRTYTEPPAVNYPF